MASSLMQSYHPSVLCCPAQGGFSRSCHSDCFCQRTLVAEVSPPPILAAFLPLQKAGEPAAGSCRCETKEERKAKMSVNGNRWGQVGQVQTGKRPSMGLTTGMYNVEAPMKSEDISSVFSSREGSKKSPKLVQLHLPTVLCLQSYGNFRVEVVTDLQQSHVCGLRWTFYQGQQPWGCENAFLISKS